MAKKSKKSSLLVLPEELLVEVLLKLPVEFLVGLRSVCKLFNTCISSKSFRRSHLQLWSNRETKMKHVFLTQDFAPDHEHDDHVSRGKKLCSEFAKSAFGGDDEIRNCRFLFEDDDDDDEDRLQFGGCYDGILCFYEFWRLSDPRKPRDLVIYLCNPALNQCNVVSRQRKLMFSKRMTKVCFAPDPASDDYKIIVVSVCKYGHGSKVYVFRLNDCRWSEIDTSKAGTGPSSCYRDYSRVSDLLVHKGSVYWLINYVQEDSDDDYNELNVLDLRRETVREIVLPDYLGYHHIPDGPKYILRRHQGSLAMFYDYNRTLSDEHLRIDYDYGVKLCLMKEEENDGISWGKPIKFDYRVSCKLCGQKVGSETCDCVRRFICKMPTAATNSFGWLMSDENETTYVLSDAESKESLGKFHIPGSQSLGNDCVTADYVPSLVSVLPGHD